MKITQEADYALRVVLYLSQHKNVDRIEAKVIAEKEAIPLRFLLKLLRKLNQAQITKSFRGANGGYALAKEPVDITLRQVIEAIDGPIYVNRCLLDASTCTAGKGNHCTIHKTLNHVRDNLVRDLEQTNFAMLVLQEL